MSRKDILKYLKITMAITNSANEPNLILSFSKYYFQSQKQNTLHEK